MKKITQEEVDEMGTGWLYLSGCDLKGITLPQTIGGDLDLEGCKNIPAKLPKVKGTIYR